MIFHTQQEAAMIKAENEAMKMALADSNITDFYATAKPQVEPSDATVAASISSPPSSTEALKESEISTIERIDEKTVTLAFNETVGTPCFSISSHSPPVHSIIASDSEEEKRFLSPEQEQAAINFILWSVNAIKPTPANNLLKQYA